MTTHHRPKHSRARAAARAWLALLLALVTPASAPLAQVAPPPARAAQGQPARQSASAAAPRLVLLIVVDQFRFDYFERFGDLFAPNGLRRLLRDGASWTQANYDHFPAETAPGHATMMTGAWPSETGIVGNFWYDRERGKVVLNVTDESAKLLGGAGEGETASSPHTLVASTVGDELKLATSGRSKVVGVSHKDRAAILPAGRAADAAYWFSSQTGRFVTSDYYLKEVPAWVARFNDSRPADKYFGKRWERLLAAAEYERRAGRDDAEWENFDAANNKDTRTFPHLVTGGAQSPGKEFYDAITYTPFANEVLVAFAEQAVVGENLGADADTDVLTVSFSANDIVGHRFGPYSHEAMDATLRVDRDIARLLDFVEARVGLRNTVVAFTADHGVSPVPEHAAAMRLPGGRVQTADLTAAVKKALRARFGKGDSAPDNTADYVLAFSNYSFYFNREALRRDGVNQEEAERVAGDAALTVPGISRYFTRTQLMRGAVSPADPVARRALHGFYARRAGDVVVIQNPFHYIMSGRALTATHGAPYSYDTHVPLVIMGGGVAPGSYVQPATPADIAPTLSAILRVQPPSNATGRVLAEALR